MAEEKEWYKDGRFVITIIVSSLAIIISFVAFLFSINLFSPFDLQTYSNGAYFLLGNISYEDRRIGNIQTPIFIVPIEFLNKGEQSGVIEDVFLNVSKEGSKVTYVPKFEIDIIALHKNSLFDPNQITKPFQPFGLNGNERVAKAIVFFPLLPQNVILSGIGNYSVEIFIKDSSSSNFYIKKLNLNLEMKENVFEDIRIGNLVFLRNPKGYDSFHREE